MFHVGPIWGAGAGISLVPEWFTGADSLGSAESFVGSGLGSAMARGPWGVSFATSKTNQGSWIGVGPSFGIPSLNLPIPFAGAGVYSKTYHNGKISLY